VGFPIRKDHTFVFGSYDQLNPPKPLAGPTRWRPRTLPTSCRPTFPITLGRHSSRPIRRRWVRAELHYGCGKMTKVGLGTCTGYQLGGMPCDMPLFQPGVLSTSTPRNGIQWNARVDQIFGNGSNRLYANVFRMTASQSSPVRVQTSIRIRPPRPTTRP